MWRLFILVSFLLLASIHAELVEDPEYWLANIPHQGVAAFNPSPADYKVFRNVKDYGAQGDGVTDDTAAINAAISDGGRFAPSSRQTSTTTPAIVYFPAGTYVISTPIVDFYFTQLIGNPNSLPILKASSGFKGGYLIDGDQYQSDGLQGWNSTNVFFRQIRNLRLDTTQIPANVGAIGIHWPTGQATSIQNVHIALNSEPETRHQGLFIENGSGGFISDVSVTGGYRGVSVGNQQFTVRNLTVSNSVTCVYQIWDWGWTWQGLHLSQCGTAFSMDSGGPDSQQVGSVNIIDSVIENSPVFVDTARSSSTWSNGSLILENIRLNNVSIAVRNVASAVLPGTAGSTIITTWGQGHRYSPSGPENFQGSLTLPPRPSALLSSGSLNYYSKPKPQYEAYPVSSFLTVRNAGAKGDGSTDDTSAIQSAIDTAAASGKILFFDQGTYKVTSTLHIPPGSRIVGEAYPAILASGAVWSDINRPMPVIEVGKPGEKGSIEWSDMLVSTQGSTPGAVLIEWNLAGDQGSGMWDVHARIGGFAGSNLQVQQCPIEGGVSSTCESAYMAMHVTSQASGVYLENVWLWTADHDVDAPADMHDVNHTRISVYSGRGLLVEGKNIWLYGTSVEHFSLYQYQFVNAQSVVAGFLQTETPYYQPNPPADKSPYLMNVTLHDPDYSRCPPGKCSALALRILETKDIFIYGAGLYSFFNYYDTSCSDFPTEGCQTHIFSVEGNSTSLVLYSLNTVGVEYMVAFGTESLGDSSENLAEYGGTIAAFSVQPRS